MHVELTDLFRCPQPHRESWLVAAAHHTEARVILDGVLGCPECGAEYTIRDGVARFDERAVPPAPDAAVDPELPVRIAALLDATDASLTVAMVGATGALARAMQAVVPVRCVVVDAPDDTLARSTLGLHDAPLAIIRSHGTLPVATGALRGVYAAAGAPADFVAALRAGGRLVAPVHREVPAGITELARDATHWVGEKIAGAAPGGLVALQRR